MVGRFDEFVGSLAVGGLHFALRFPDRIAEVRGPHVAGTLLAYADTSHRYLIARSVLAYTA
jgi:hypothetical protein